LLIVHSRAPGRVNLIGEHTDYNLGWVLPVATGMGISLKAASRKDDQVKVYAGDLAEKGSFSLATLTPENRQGGWLDYPAGVFWALREAGYPLSGAELSFGGDIPVGSGLSSSAALETATAAALDRLFKLNLSGRELALLCQKAENYYVGVQCGIMDQFASMLSRQGHALLLDCRSLEYDYVPLSLEGQILAIIDSRVKRSLAASEYNRRREECREALDLINKKSGSNYASLRELTPDVLERARIFLPEKLYRRSLFVVEENRRVLEAVEAFCKNDLALAGRLFNQSHAGLRDYFEVSCRELDLLASIARDSAGVWGARMTGAGFGGCLVALVEKEHLPGLQARIAAETKGLLEKEPHIYTTIPAAGCIAGKHGDGGSAS